MPRGDNHAELGEISSAQRSLVPMTGKKDFLHRKVMRPDVANQNET